MGEATKEFIVNLLVIICFIGVFVLVVKTLDYRLDQIELKLEKIENLHNIK